MHSTFLLDLSTAYTVVYINLVIFVPTIRNVSDLILALVFANYDLPLRCNNCKTGWDITSVRGCCLFQHVHVAMWPTKRPDAHQSKEGNIYPCLKQLKLRLHQIREPRRSQMARSSANRRILWLRLSSLLPSIIFLFEDRTFWLEYNLFRLVPALISACYNYAVLQ